MNSEFSTPLKLMGRDQAIQRSALGPFQGRSARLLRFQIGDLGVLVGNVEMSQNEQYSTENKSLNHLFFFKDLDS